jgi:MSHA biogenesis protein MshE
MQRINLGNLLLQAGLIDQETIDKALEIQKKNGEKFGKILISMGVLTESELLNLLSQQLEIPVIDLNFFDINPDCTLLLEEIYARRFRCIVLENHENWLLIGMADPIDINAIDSLTKILKKFIKTAIVSEEALLRVLDRVYRRTQEISNFAKELSGEMVDDSILFQDDLFNELPEQGKQAPVVKLLNSIFYDAVQARASDIHIEPDETVLRIRFRIDGILNESILEDKRIVSALIQRLKLRARLDIAEHRIPQDGRFNFKIYGQSYDVRVSTIPTEHGEAVVMRLLQQSAPVTDLSKLGIDPKLEERIKEIYSKPYGMLLVTGPTGSGKTTTLYSILARLNTSERKIITVEDPVEYRMSRINQVQVNTKIDLSFARILRAILRQDPDIILVGEIRDSETAQIAMRAAVTGHMVLATLHTNDAITSALRLIDMGTEGYMVAAAVKAIIGQRLVRTLCKVCIKDHTPNIQESAWLKYMKLDSTLSYKNSKGCSHCGYRGYVGRKGIYEMLELNSKMLNALRLNNTQLFTKAALDDKSFHPLANSVLNLVQSGETSIEEAMRIAGQLDEEFKLRDNGINE